MRTFTAWLSTAIFASLATNAEAVGPLKRVPQMIAETSAAIGPAFSVHEIDGEAGFNPDQPRPDDIKAVGDGHVWWIRRDAIVGDEVERAEQKPIVVGDCKQSSLVVSLNLGAAQKLKRYADSHPMHRAGIFLSGHMIGHVLTFSPVPRDYDYRDITLRDGEGEFSDELLAKNILSHGALNRP